MKVLEKELLQLVESTYIKFNALSVWIKCLDNQLASSLLTTCSRLVIIKLEQAIRIVKSLNQKIVTGGDKLGHPFYNLLTMHPNEFMKGCLKFSSQGGVTSMRWHVARNFSLPVNDI